MIPHNVNHKVIGRVCTSNTTSSGGGGGVGEGGGVNPKRFEYTSTKIHHGCDFWAEWKHLYI